MDDQGGNLKVKRGADGLPVAFQVFAPGENATNKGTFIYDAAAAKSVMAAHEDQGNKLVIDYEHQTASDPPQEAPAAATFDPSPKPDGSLWAENVKWTDRAAKMLAGKEYLYFSPWFDHDAEGRITNLRNLALTNFPATKKMPMLVAAKADTQAKGSQMADAAQEAAPTEAPAEDTQAGGDMAAIEAALNALVAAIQGEEKTEPESMMKLLDAAKAAYGPPPKKDEPAADPAMCSAAPAAAAVAAKGGTDFQQVAALTGKDSPADVVGTIAAWKSSHDQVAQLKATVAKLEGAAKSRDFDQQVAEGRAAGKLTEADVKGEFITQLRAASNGSQLLKAYLATAHAKIQTVELRAPDAASAIIALTEDEEEYARKQGLDLKDLVEFKARRAAERNG